MKTKRIIITILALILALVVYSLLPPVFLYSRKEPKPYTNSQAVAKLKDNKGDYFVFMVLGDNHAGFVFDDSATLKLIRSMNREDRFKKIPIDFVAIAGDVTFRGREWDYRIFNIMRSLIKWPVICAIGNHDDDKGGVERFKKYIGEKDFAFYDRNSYFIVLDNSAGDLSEGQFARFEMELRKSQAYTHRFVILHKAPLSLYQQSWFRPEPSPWSYRFMKLCEQYKVDIVFSGHEHMFKQETLGGVKYIMTGGGGMITQLPKREGGFLHYIVVRVYGDYVDYEVRKISPPLWEFLTYYLWKDVFYSFKALL